MTPIRLFILDELATRGSTHGHHLRHLAQEEYADLWTDINVGGFYAALNRMATEGLVRDVRTESAGRYPERTIYEITPEGRTALAALHDEGLRTLVFRMDPFDLAFSRAHQLTVEHLHEILTARRTQYAEREAALRQQTADLADRLSPAERYIVRHLLDRLSTEVRWHDAVLADLPAIVAGFTPPSHQTEEEQA